MTLQQMVEDSHRIVFFGGAGVSTESGIPDFRSSDGLYRQAYRYPPEEVVSHGFFMQHTADFYEFYKDKMLCLDAKPNAAHKALAALEQAGRLSAVITQNIDGLHQAAGSRNVLELHGSIHRNYCMDCGAFYDGAFVKQAAGVPHCSCGGLIKPDVVLYGENLNSGVINRAIAAIDLILDNIKFDISFTDLFFVPVFNIILSNSSLDIFSFPYFFIFFLGLSDFGMFFINVLFIL